MACLQGVSGLPLARLYARERTGPETPAMWSQSLISFSSCTTYCVNGMNMHHYVKSGANNGIL